TAQSEIEQVLELSSPEYLPAVAEPSDAAPTPAILLNHVEDQPNNSMLDAQPTAQFEIGQVLELSAVDPAAVTSDTTPLNTEEQHSTYYSNDEDIIPDNAPSKWSVLKAFFGLKVQREPESLPAVNEPPDAAPMPAILLNYVEDQPNNSVLDAQPTAQFEIGQVLELSSVDPAAVTSETTPLNTEEQPHSLYYSNDEDSIPDNAPSKWSVLKAFFGLKVQREPEYLPAVTEPSDDAPAPAILLNDVEDQPNSSVLDAPPTAQVEIGQVLELSAVDPAALTSDTTPL